MQCVYKDCSNSTISLKKTRNTNITYFPFPKPHVNTRKFFRWKFLCGLIADERENVALEKGASVCCLHFADRKPTPINPDPVAYNYKEKVCVL